MRIKVVPNAKKFQVVSKNGKILVKVKSRAENNLANLELLKGLGKLLDSRVFILKGTKSREKEIVSEKFSEEEFLKKILSLAEKES